MEIQKEIIEKLLKNPPKDPFQLAEFKRKISQEYKIPSLKNIELLKAYHKFLKEKRLKSFDFLEKLLRTRPIRSLSGVVNVTVLTKPYPCPGKCIFCPKEKGIPKSYLSGEPAVERAKALKYHPYFQVKKRIENLKEQGHLTEKIDLRIVGGTFSFYPKKYQIWFIGECFKACNNSKGEISSLEDLKKQQKKNEKSAHRIVSLSIETRPDFINIKEAKWLRELGVTFVELGVQSIYDDVLKLNFRGHSVKETILATKILKDAGFKVLYQMMPNLLGSDLKKDEKMFEELFKNPSFQPDYLKIYPCALLKETPLYEEYLKGNYHPYSDSVLIELLKKIKQKIPYYVRIQRIVRDIPSQKIIKGGAKISNLRQIIKREMEKEKLICKCIRCREIRENYDPKEKIFLFRQDYFASEGKEIFLSFENKERNKILSFLRLRIPSFFFNRQEKNFYDYFKVLKGAGIIREVKTFGREVAIGKKEFSPQHQGLGKKLIKKAEKICKKEFKLKKIAVISGVGAREYFRKLGYRLRDTFMIKKL